MKIYAVDGLFGQKNLYDESGRHIGYGTKGLFGSTDYYLDDTGYCGSSEEGLLGTVNFFDSSGKLKAFATDGLFGGKTIVADTGNGFSVEDVFGVDNVYLPDDFA